MKHSHIFLDTSFCIILMNARDPDHNNTRKLFDWFLQHSDRISFSTIVAAEYGIGAPIDTLPLALGPVTIVPFNLIHAAKAAQFGKATFEASSRGSIVLEKRVVIPNDTKILAQAEIERADLLCARDKNMKQVHSFLKQEGLLDYDYLDLRTPLSTFTGTFDF
jgi:hypothetical protein